jgi:muramoyltetrapeptide carboxypeptidase LdcA involved in peptidoglycan recycling
MHEIESPQHEKARDPSNSAPGDGYPRQGLQAGTVIGAGVAGFAQQQGNQIKMETLEAPTILEVCNREIAQLERQLARAKQVRDRILQENVGRLPDGYFNVYGYGL